MLDALDTAIGSLFASSGAPTRGGRKRTSGEEFVWSLAILGFPAADFFLVLWLGLAVVLPLLVLFAVLTPLLGYRFRADQSLTVIATVLCVMFCLAASFFGVLLGAGGFFGF